MRMTDGYGRVLVQQKLGCRQAHDVASTHHYGPFALYLHVSGLQKSDYSSRSARNAVLRVRLRFGSAAPECGHVFRMKTVHILLARYRIKGLQFVYVRWQRKLNKYPVHAVIFVEKSYLFQKRLFRSVSRKMHGSVLYANLFAGFSFAPDITRAGRVITYQNHSQMRHSSVFGRESGHLLSELGLDIVR